MKSQINTPWLGEREVVLKYFNKFVSLKRGLKDNLIPEYMYLHGKIYGVLGCDICTD